MRVCANVGVCVCDRISVRLVIVLLGLGHLGHGGDTLWCVGGRGNGAVSVVKMRQGWRLGGGRGVMLGIGIGLGMGLGFR